MKGDNHLRTYNEPNGFEVYYNLSKDIDDDIQITVTDYSGKEVFNRKVVSTKGLHKLYINTAWLNPDPYQISLKIGNRTITKTARVLESPIWSVGRL